VAVLSITGLLFMIPLCFLGKERITVRTEDPDVSFKDMFRFLTHNKYMFIYFGSFILARAFDVTGPLNMYFARYNLGDEKLLTLFAVVGSGVGLVVALLIPALCKRVDKFYLFWWATVASIVLTIISYFVGYRSLTPLLIFAGLGGIPGGVLAIVMFMFTPDCVEYGVYKTGVNASGIAFALQTFSAKLLAAIAAALAALSLAFIGFVSGEGAAQLDGFPDKLWFIYKVLPTIGNLIALPLLYQYKLRDKDVQVMARYNSGQATREEADAALGGRY
jgi:Na+/melibiose symporter-like transporter